MNSEPEGSRNVSQSADPVLVTTADEGPNPQQKLCQNGVVFPDVVEDAVYILQRVLIDGGEYNFFYGSGCKGFVSNYDAVQRLGSDRTFQLEAGPIKLEGVGGMTMETPHGYYGVKLPVVGGEALFSGLCLDMITQPFPLYPLKGDVERDIHSAFVLSGGGSNFTSHSRTFSWRSY